VLVIESPKASWFLLDSLHATNVTPGELGAQQHDWLAHELDARSDKAAWSWFTIISIPAIRRPRV
jgi:hypothetical protein